MFNYEIGGNERKVDVHEAFADISPNKTLFIQQLTDREPLRPELTEGLKTVEDVFEHFKPTVHVDYERADGSPKGEVLHFQQLSDFGVKAIVQQSDHLRDLSVERDTCLTIARQLKSNKTLKAMLENPETKKAFASALAKLAGELEANI
ncbi:type VI secretion system contractile sheath small subunit [Dinghuibacter silviterrae]|uniref:Type VI secretion system (T6SS) VipA/Hcp2 family protein n=1 Tax=Dinghuibacter silviterrae TaxID=1539049 RepID=A0A4R8DH38_9BACT|nr:type VI secretion system contractile sheath small subunit [Dinghuibacter silviterrae]TDW96807.1 type VI secretion system (T6SS) VipA/Hcp2 family protein [Dinghuibacter silviterrae]